MTSTRAGGIERGERPERDRGYLVGARHALRRRWVLVLCVGLAFSSLAVSLDAILGHEYTAETLVRVQDLGETGAEGASGERIEEVQEAVGAEEVARDAMSEIGWEDGIGEFLRRLDVEIGAEGELAVVFSAATPERAAAGANAYAGAFVARVERLESGRLAGGAINAGAEVAREARPQQVSSWSRGLVVGLAALVPGLAAGGALAMAVGRRDGRLRGPRDTEISLGAPVLAVIPDYGAGPRESEEDGVVR